MKARHAGTYLQLGLKIAYYRKLRGLTQEQLAERVAELGKQLTADYRGKDLLVIGLLKGSLIFMSDLIRAMDVDMAIDFMVVSSYGDSTSSSGNIKINLDIKRDLKGKHVLLVEDILDTGTTLSFIRDLIRLRQPESVKICTLLDKDKVVARKVDIQADYVGFPVDDRFIIGYGLDYAQKYRNLPYIAVLKPEAYA